MLRTRADTCCGISARLRRWKILFERRKPADARKRKPVSPSRRNAALIAYRAGTDLAGKGAFFIVTIVAARRLSQDAFGVFSLGTTVGWIAAVATDFGIQLHLARAVAQDPGSRDRLLRRWLGLRLWTAGLACLAVAIGVLVRGAASPFGLAIFLLTVVYV